ncbi:hypothetical protein [Salmonella enterica]|uniref:Uncharacterized protein n=1 Tax=Salmonella enterica subsp. indica serovar 6,14,25:z10:1,(2),7 str. 1121 TaxID=1173950 RepID=V1I016_SALER|nr:hypothetical protein [Salmonella enterica]ESE88164.1 hypothetical protein SEI61121_01145 [Salmonella enterica subsp. indica serovar 6,14,25:z10:1,(2),7 str. 1121]
MARGSTLILLLPCLALAQPLPEAYLRAAEHFRVPPELLWAVTQTESGANLSGRHIPWPWTLNIKGTGYRYANREQACQALLAAIRRTSPKRIDVRLGQINIGWHRAYFDSPCDALHPLQNLSLTAQLDEELSQLKLELDFRQALTRNTASQILQRKQQRDQLQGQAVEVPDDSDRRLHNLNNPQPDSPR